MIEFFNHLFGMCGDSHSHLKVQDVFFSFNEIRDKISVIKNFFLSLIKNKE